MSAASEGFELASGIVRGAPPLPGGAPYWRLSVHDPDTGIRVQQTTGGRTYESALAAAREIERRILAVTPAARRACTGAELIERFLSPTRRKDTVSGQWSDSHARKNASLVRLYVGPVWTGVAVAKLSAKHSVSIYNSCPTNDVQRKVRTMLSAVVNLGVEEGYLRPDQATIHRAPADFKVPMRPPRRAGFNHGETIHFIDDDEVPTLAAVADLASALPDKPLWEGLVNTAAFVGPREGELFALRARDLEIESGIATVARIRRQILGQSTRSDRTSGPKNGRRRAAICETSPLDFPLGRWLADRAVEALDEAGRGFNPQMLLFPSPCGYAWHASNFQRRRFSIAAATAGWDELEWVGPVRVKRDGAWVYEDRPRRDWKHPMHSLRHVYACTARDTWHWTAGELCANGGWADPMFVVARYYGLQRGAVESAARKQSVPTAPLSPTSGGRNV